MTTLTALALTCSLKPSPEPSSTALLASQVLADLEKHGVSGTALRVVDYDVKPGVEADMGDGDEWPFIREQILAADVIVFAAPTWMGQLSSVGMRVLERLDADLTTRAFYNKVAIAAVVGNEDGAHHIVSQLFQAMGDVGFTIPAQGSTYWNGEAMHKVDYIDLKKTPDSTADATAAVALNAAHLAGVLKDRQYPAKE
jgi:multimeric flavodoxin WrbA